MTVLYCAGYSHRGYGYGLLPVACHPGQAASKHDQKAEDVRGRAQAKAGPSH